MDCKRLDLKIIRLREDVRKKVRIWGLPRGKLNLQPYSLEEQRYMFSAKRMSDLGFKNLTFFAYSILSIPYSKLFAYSHITLQEQTYMFIVQKHVWWVILKVNLFHIIQSSSEDLTWTVHTFSNDICSLLLCTPKSFHTHLSGSMFLRTLLQFSHRLFWYPLQLLPSFQLSNIHELKINMSMCKKTFPVKSISLYVSMKASPQCANCIIPLRKSPTFTLPGVAIFFLLHVKFVK